MSKEILFTEKQKFNQWWLWLIILGVNGIVLSVMIKEFISKGQLGGKSITDTEPILAFAIILFVSFSLLIFRLDTIIKADGIYVRFFPFHIKFKHYTWESLTKSYVRQYSPILEYGGWGLRIGLFGRGRAFNVSGNKGLQLEFTDNKKLLIGTNKPEEIEKVLQQLGVLKH